MNPAKQIWHRAIILVDMNAFFASVEQLDHPELRNKPIAITNGDTGTCIITCSYEARKYGIKTGMRIYEAQKICKQLIRVPSHPQRYVEISTKIMEALHQITPDIEIFSIDEAFLDVTRCQKIYDSPIAAAKQTQKIIHEVSGLPCSIGLSGDKTTAKYAAESKKPNGFTVIPPWEAEQTLANVPVTELCGIGEGTAKFLARYGVLYCKDMARLPISILSKRFGNLGRRLWLMCQGKDPEPVQTTIAPPKSIGHGKILPPKTNDIEIVKVYFRHMSEKVAMRLRHNNMFASQFFIGMRLADWGWEAIKYDTCHATQHGADIYRGCEKLIAAYLKIHKEGYIRQVQVTALNLTNHMRQLDLFDDEEVQDNELLDHAIDAINDRFGNYTIIPASFLARRPQKTRA
jgi:DNA polymerase IV